jgi:CRISPR-associated endonuclease/helicase Cas3
MLDTIVESAAVDRFLLPHVELGFPIIAGNLIPANNAYGVYSAISHRIAALHDRDDISIQSIAGKLHKPGKIQLSSHSQLKLRTPYNPEIIGLVLPLAGQTLTIGIHDIQLGIPMMSPLQPFSVLRSRITTIKKFQEPAEFLSAAQRQLDTLEISGTVRIPLNKNGEIDRKVIKIKSFTIVGFGLEVSNLSDRDSLKLQIAGLGGKHKMGCGIFNPLPRRVRMLNE